MMCDNRFSLHDDNYVVLSGLVREDLEFIANFNGTKIYKTYLGVLRLSGLEDVLPIYLSCRLSGFEDVKKGIYVKIEGSMRSSQYRDGNKVKRTRVYTQVGNILVISSDLPNNWNDNNVILTGKMFQNPLLRKSKTDKSIDVAEVMLEIYRGHNKWVHIPLVIWGTDAKYISKFSKGTEISVVGRFQSRYFIRHSNSEDVCFEDAISYEVSVSNLSIKEE